MRTTIALQGETRERLKAIGSKGETYDQILNRLLDERQNLETRIEELEHQLKEFVVFEPVKARREDAEGDAD